jgi:hypothetical protein
MTSRAGWIEFGFSLVVESLGDVKILWGSVCLKSDVGGFGDELELMLDVTMLVYPELRFFENPTA